jgi:hypothetical protein
VWVMRHLSPVRPPKSSERGETTPGCGVDPDSSTNATITGNTRLPPNSKALFAGSMAPMIVSAPVGVTNGAHNTYRT